MRVRTILRIALRRRKRRVPALRGRKTRPSSASSPMPRSSWARPSAPAWRCWRSYRLSSASAAIIRARRPASPGSVSFARGLRALPDFGFTHDLCILWHQIEETVELVARCPAVQFILDHCAKPAIAAPRPADADARWRAGMRALAALPNVVCKLSGLVTEADHARWQPSDLQPYLEYALAVFGTERLLFGSDWPVAQTGQQLGALADFTLREALQPPIHRGRTSSHLRRQRAAGVWVGSCRGSCPIMARDAVSRNIMTKTIPAPRAESRAGDTTRGYGQYSIETDNSYESNHSRPLWPYQEEMLEALRRALPKGPVMATLATGGGKTAVAARLSAEYRRVLFVAPSRSVVNQAPKEFMKWRVIAANASDGKWDFVLSRNAKVVVASYILAGNRLKNRSDLGQFDLLIVDEAHHAADGKSVVSRLVRDAHASGLHVLGLTATCWRLSVHEGFSRTWRQLLQFPDWHTLHQNGFLADCDLHFLAPEEVIRGGKPGSHGEYTNSGILELNKRRPQFTQGAVDWWASAARHKTQGRWLSTICYAVGQTHAVNVARRFKAKDARVGLILSDKVHLKRAPTGIEKDTKRAIERFRNRELDVLVNVQMVTEGFDAPASRMCAGTAPHHERRPVVADLRARLAS